MNDNELNSLAETWIAFTLAPQKSSERNDLFWVFDQVWELTYESPQDLWLLIVKILSLNNSDPILMNLSAGPLEDLLSKHGDSFINRIELEAKENPKFASLLGGVWQNSMTDEIWMRVQHVCNRKGWDCISK